MNNKPVKLTENQVLKLSALVTNEVARLTQLPITESEDAYLALEIAEWLRNRLGVKIVNPATDPEGWTSEIPTTEGDYLLMHDESPGEVNTVEVWYGNGNILKATTPWGIAELHALQSCLINPLWKEL